ncbi:aldo/keto reductase [Nocardioides bruguierae]|uniref:aldo/keto reductase n=1 Tax=Nocardioides bruguierae TaxID=2945102 RepID=UPI0020202626|nr:aldo/keto reductase [Nocardioides bruguierae]MCL8025495.1 aldo/keto reductase [Nocardioides bruguierae]
MTTAGTAPRWRGLTPLVTSPWGLGGAQLGNLYRATDDDTARAGLEAAWAAGVRYFDTAPHYGLGLSERRLGAFLAQHPRSEVVVSTKVGRLLVPDPAGAARRDDEGFDVPADHRRVRDYSAAGVRASLEQSLERLGLDRVDVVYLHDPEDHWEQARDEGLPALLELRDAGLVGAVGAGMNLAEPLTTLVTDHDVDLVMCAGRHTLLEQSWDLLDAAADRGVGVVLAGVWNSGLLARPRPAPDATYDYLPAPAALLARVHTLADVCEAHGTTLPEAAIAFAAAHPAVASVVLGAGGPDQVREAARRATAPVPAALWDALVAAGLLDRTPDSTNHPTTHPLPHLMHRPTHAPATAGTPEEQP